MPLTPERDRILRTCLTSAYGLEVIDSVKLPNEDNDLILSIRASGSRFIAGISPMDKPTGGLEAEVALLVFLESRGVRSERPVPGLDGKDIRHIATGGEDREFVLYRAIEGGIHDETMTPEKARRAGHLLASLHREMAAFPAGGFTHFPEFGLEVFTEPSLLELQRLAARFDRLGDRLVQFADTSRAAIVAADLPRGLCHGDFHAGNFIYDADGQPWAIDFELCRSTWLAWDLATFIWSILPREDYGAAAIGLARDSVAEFLKGYRDDGGTVPSGEGLFGLVLLRHLWMQAGRMVHFAGNEFWTSREHLERQIERMEHWTEMHEAGILP